MSAEPGKPTATTAIEETRPARRKLWPRLVLAISVIAAIVLLLKVFGPNGATYEEYQQLEPGMSRAEVEAIIGQGDYWYHMEGEYQVANWVNKDGTYIQTVFDKKNVLVDAFWKIGWQGGNDTKDTLYGE